MKGLCSDLTAKIYKFPRVPMKERKNELDKRRGRGGKEQEFSSHTWQKEPGYFVGYIAVFPVLL